MRDVLRRFRQARGGNGVVPARVELALAAAFANRHAADHHVADEDVGRVGREGAGEEVHRALHLAGVAREGIVELAEEMLVLDGDALGHPR